MLLEPFDVWIVWKQKDNMFDPLDVWVIWKQKDNMLFEPLDLQVVGNKRITVC